MSLAALGLVTLAAVLHLAWNALTKRAEAPFPFLWSSMAVASLGFLPFSLALGRGEPFAEAAPVLLGSAALHAVYFWTLTRAYREGDLSLVYPVARGLGIGLVPLLALPLFAERPSVAGAIGMAAVFAGVLVTGTARTKGASGGFLARGGGWAAVTGLLVASYSLVDRTGARLLHPVPYLGFMTLGAVALSAPLALADREALRHEWRVNGRRILVASSMNLTGYVLVLFAYRFTQTGYVVATRELSIVLSTLVGPRLLGEPRSERRVLGAVVVVLGISAIALGG